MVKKSISGISKQYYVQFHLHKHPVSEFSLSLEIVEHNTWKKNPKLFKYQITLILKISQQSIYALFVFVMSFIYNFLSAVKQIYQITF